jgi:hypothetical protein
LLSSHPCDATFDQLGKVEEFSKRGYSFIASYDLKSATDLIPIQLYEKLIGHWTVPEFAEAWVKVLTSRGYAFDYQGIDKLRHSRDLHYTRGQPMGTLSSWASLAVVHHFLVFLAAERAGKDFFS